MATRKCGKGLENNNLALRLKTCATLPAPHLCCPLYLSDQVRIAIPLAAATFNLSLPISQNLPQISVPKMSDLAKLSTSPHQLLQYAMHLPGQHKRASETGRVVS